jgi:hypothetical protein
MEIQACPCRKHTVLPSRRDQKLSLRGDPCYKLHLMQVWLCRLGAGQDGWRSFIPTGGFLMYLRRGGRDGCKPIPTTTPTPRLYVNRESLAKWLMLPLFAHGGTTRERADADRPEKRWGSFTGRVAGAVVFYRGEWRRELRSSGIQSAPGDHSHLAGSSVLPKGEAGEAGVELTKAGFQG